MSVKKIIRILFGLPLAVIPMLLASWVWLFDSEESWKDTVGKYSWYLISGQWEKLPE